MDSPPPIPLRAPAPLLVALAFLIGPFLPGTLPAQDWLQKTTMARAAPRMAFDSGRDRLVAHVGAQTWEWDGVAWSARAETPAGGTGPGDGPMAYDSDRQVVVLYDGSHWEWNGVLWTQRQHAIKPPYPPYDTMAYDPMRRRLVLYGGRDPTYFSSIEETWEFDGSAWTRISGVGPGSAGARVAWHPQRQRVVLFGGAKYWGYSATYMWQDDLWEWDGTRWLKINTAVKPQQRGSHGLAYDAARQRLVMFGGDAKDAYGVGPGYTDTWEWGAGGWQKINVSGPSAGSGAAMVYDAARGRTALFGPGTDELWDYDGTAWQREPNLQTAPPASGPRLAYDSGRQRVVAWGNSLNAATWEWDGVSWRRVGQGSPAPPTYNPFALAYDAARGVTTAAVNTGGSLQTWDWDGTTWTQRQPANSPSSLWRLDMVDEPGRGRLLVLGDTIAQPTQTWEWDGNDWTQRQPATAPPSGGYALAHDALRGITVAFGAANPSGPGATWEWDGTNWTERQSTLVPAARRGHDLVYHAGRGRVVLFGGQDANGTRLDETWEWDGVQWRQVFPDQKPSRRDLCHMTYDAGRDRIVLFGGDEPWFGSRRTVGDTWVYGRTTVSRAQAYGQGCAGASEPPQLIAYGKPVVGASRFALDVLGARTGAPLAVVLGAGEAALPLGSGCVLLVDPTTYAAVLPGQSNAVGFASLPLPIPAAPYVLGARVAAQVAVLDPAAGTLGIALSGGMRLRVGE